MSISLSRRQLLRCAGAGFGSLALTALLNDETLVDGDIVSTPKGLRVFHGQPNAPHSWADFK